MNADALADLMCSRSSESEEQETKIDSYEHTKQMEKHILPETHGLENELSMSEKYEKDIPATTKVSIEVEKANTHNNASKECEQMLCEYNKQELEKLVEESQPKIEDNVKLINLEEECQTTNQEDVINIRNELIEEITTKENGRKLSFAEFIKEAGSLITVKSENLCNKSELPSPSNINAGKTESEEEENNAGQKYRELEINSKQESSKKINYSNTYLDNSIETENEIRIENISNNTCTRNNIDNIQKGTVRKRAKKTFSIAEWFERQAMMEVKSSSSHSAHKFAENAIASKGCESNNLSQNHSCSDSNNNRLHEERKNITETNIIGGMAIPLTNSKTTRHNVVEEIIRQRSEQEAPSKEIKNIANIADITNNNNKNKQINDNCSVNDRSSLLPHSMPKLSKETNKLGICNQQQELISQESVEHIVESDYKMSIESKSKNTKYVNGERCRSNDTNVSSCRESNFNVENHNSYNITNNNTDQLIKQTVVVKHIKPTSTIEHLRALRNRVLPTSTLINTSTTNACNAVKQTGFLSQHTSSMNNTTNCRLNTNVNEKNASFYNDKNISSLSKHNENQNIIIGDNDVNMKSGEQKRELKYNIHTTTNNSNDSSVGGNKCDAEHTNYNYWTADAIGDKKDNDIVISESTHVNNSVNKEEEHVNYSEQHNEDKTYMLGDEVYTSVPTHMSTTEENEIFEEISKLLLRYCLGRDEKRHNTTIPLPPWSVLPPGLGIDSEKASVIPVKSKNEHVPTELESKPKQQEEEQQHEELLESKKEVATTKCHSQQTYKTNLEKVVTEMKQSCINAEKWPTPEEATRNCKKIKEHERVTKKNKEDVLNAGNSVENCNSNIITENSKLATIKKNVVNESNAEQLTKSASKESIRDADCTSNNTESKNELICNASSLEPTLSKRKYEANEINANIDSIESGKIKYKNTSNWASNANNTFSSHVEDKPTFDSNVGGGNDDEDDDNSLNKELELYFHLVRLYQTKKVTLRTLELVHEMLKHTRVLPHVPTMNNFSNKPIITHDPISRRRAYLQQVIISLLEQMKEEKLREERNDETVDNNDDDNESKKRISLSDFDSQIEKIIKGIPLEEEHHTLLGTAERTQSNISTGYLGNKVNNFNQIRNGFVANKNDNTNYHMPFNIFAPPTLFNAFSNNANAFTSSMINSFQPNFNSAIYPTTPFYPVNYNPFVAPNPIMPFHPLPYQPTMPHRTWPCMPTFTQSESLSLTPSGTPEPTTAQNDTQLEQEQEEQKICVKAISSEKHHRKDDVEKLAVSNNHECYTNVNLKRNEHNDNIQELSSTTLLSHRVNIANAEVLKKNGVVIGSETGNQSINNEHIHNRSENVISDKTTISTIITNTAASNSVAINDTNHQSHVTTIPYTTCNNAQTPFPNQYTPVCNMPCFSPFQPQISNTTFFPPQNCTSIPLPLHSVTPLPSVERESLHASNQSSNLSKERFITSTPHSTSSNPNVSSIPYLSSNTNANYFLPAPHHVISQQQPFHVNALSHQTENSNHHLCQSSIEKIEKPKDDNDDVSDEDDDNDKQLDEYVKAIMQYVQQSEEFIEDEKSKTWEDAIVSKSGEEDECTCNVLINENISNMIVKNIDAEREVSDEGKLFATDVTVPIITQEERQVLQDVQRDFKRRMENAEKCKLLDEEDRIENDEDNDICLYKVNDFTNAIDDIDSSQLNEDIDCSNMFLHICSESASSPCSPEKEHKYNSFLASDIENERGNADTNDIYEEHNETHRVLFAETEKKCVYVSSDVQNSSDSCEQKMSYNEVITTNLMNNESRDDYKVSNIPSYAEISNDNEDVCVKNSNSNNSNNNNNNNNNKDENECRITLEMRKNDENFCHINEDEGIHNDGGDNDDDEIEKEVQDEIGEDGSDNDLFNIHLFEHDTMSDIEVNLPESSEEFFELEQQEQEQQQQEEEQEQESEEYKNNELNEYTNDELNEFKAEGTPYARQNREYITPTQYIASENVSALNEYINHAEHNSSANSNNQVSNSNSKKIRISHLDNNEMSSYCHSHSYSPYKVESQHESKANATVSSKLSAIPHIKLDVGPKVSNSRETSSAKDVVAVALAQSAEKLSAISSSSSHSPSAQKINSNNNIVLDHNNMALAPPAQIKSSSSLLSSSSHFLRRPQTSSFTSQEYNTTLFAAPEPRKMPHSTYNNAHEEKNGNKNINNESNTTFIVKQVEDIPEKTQTHLAKIVTVIDNNSHLRRPVVKSVLKPTAAPFIPSSMRASSTLTTNSNSLQRVNSGNELLMSERLAGDKFEQFNMRRSPSRQHCKQEHREPFDDLVSHTFSDHNTLPSQWATPDMFDDWKEMMQNRHSRHQFELSQGRYLHSHYEHNKNERASPTQQDNYHYQNYSPQHYNLHSHPHRHQHRYKSTEERSEKFYTHCSRDERDYDCANRSLEHISLQDRYVDCNEANYATEVDERDYEANAPAQMEEVSN